MLNNRNFRIVLSFVAALLLWGYVVGYVDNTTTKSIRGIPITLTHVAELGERNLAVSGMNLESLDIEVKGTRVAISELNASDVTATVDMASASKGENDLTIIVRAPLGGVTVTERSATRVTVMVEDMVKKEVPVQIGYNGTFGEGQSGNTLNMSNSRITVSGAESLVNTVTSLQGTIDASRVTASPTDISCKLQAVNSEGNPVDNVTLAHDTITVTTVLSERKEVELIVPVEDNSSDGKVRRVLAPETIGIVGRADALAKIDSITAITLDVTNIEESGELPIQVELPEDIGLADVVSSLVAELTVSDMSTKVINFTGSDIEFRGTKIAYDYSVPTGTQIAVTLMDSADHLLGITKSDIKVICDVTNYSSGTVTCPLVIESAEKDVYGMVAAPEAVDVSIVTK